MAELRRFGRTASAIGGERSTSRGTESVPLPPSNTRRGLRRPALPRDGAPTNRAYRCRPKAAAMSAVGLATPRDGRVWSPSSTDARRGRVVPPGGGDPPSQSKNGSSPPGLAAIPARSPSGPGLPVHPTGPHTRHACWRPGAALGSRWCSSSPSSAVGPAAWCPGPIPGRRSPPLQAGDTGPIHRESDPVREPPDRRASSRVRRPSDWPRSAPQTSHSLPTGPTRQ